MNRWIFLLFVLLLLLVVHPASAVTPIQIESNLDSAVPGANVIFTITDNTNGNAVFLQYRDPSGNMNDIGLISEKSKQPVNYIWVTKGLISGVYTFYAYDSSRTVFATAPITIEKGYISMNLAGNKVSYSPGDTVRVSGIGLGQKFITVYIEGPDGKSKQAGTANVALDSTWAYSWTPVETQSGIYKISAIGSMPDTVSENVEINLIVPSGQTNNSAKGIQMPAQLTGFYSSLPWFAWMILIGLVSVVGGGLYFRRKRTNAITGKRGYRGKTPEPEKPLIFISSKSADYEYVQKLYDFLVLNNKNVFFSRETLPELGQSDYRKEIDKAIDEAKHMIVVGSSAEYFSSLWVEHEWGGFVNEKNAGRKPEGNLITLTVNAVKIEDIPLSLRMNEIIPYDPEKFPLILKYLY